MTRLQIETPDAPPPFGPYSQGIRVGDAILVAGQIPFCVETGQLAGDSVYEQTLQVLRNLCARAAPTSTTSSCCGPISAAPKGSRS